MKKNVLKLFFVGLVMAAISFPQQVRAQDSGKTWSIGPELGVDFSNWGRDAVQNDRTTGAVAGVFVTHSIVNTFGITVKALLSQRGSQSTLSGETIKTRLNYLEIPILARYFLNKEGRFRPNLFVGPSFNYLFGGNVKRGDADAVKIDNYKNFYRTFDFGVTGGLGLNYEIANETRILLDARYFYGLSDISKSNSANVNNQTINVSLGISFGF